MAENTNDQSAILLNRALETLDKWRHLPAYQLERRVDVFFGLLLPRIVAHQFQLNCEDLEVIPEFPLRKGTLDCSSAPKTANQSVKVDFAVFCRDKENPHLTLVELKTDNRSVDPFQLRRMKTAKDIGAMKLLKGVVQCGCQSKAQRKYAHLIWKLDEIGCISGAEDFRSIDLKRDKPGLTGSFAALEKSFNIAGNWSNAVIELMLIYPGVNLKPRTPKDEKILEDLHLVNFQRVKETMGEGLLSGYLDKWANCEAGRENPWENFARA